MYDKFCLYLETLSSKISEQIGKPVKKIQNKLDIFCDRVFKNEKVRINFSDFLPKKQSSDTQQKKEISFYDALQGKGDPTIRENDLTLTGDGDILEQTSSSPTQNDTTAPQQPVQEVKPKKKDLPRLRLSDSTPQPINPIIQNWALYGIQLELKDWENKKITIDIEDWFNPKGVKIYEITSGKADDKLTNIDNYIQYTTNLDIINQIEKEQIKQEEKLCDFLDQLKEKISSKTIGKV